MTKIFQVLAVSAIMLGGVTTASMAASTDGDASQPQAPQAIPAPTTPPSDSTSTQPMVPGNGVSTTTTVMPGQPMAPSGDPSASGPPNDGSGTGGASGANGGSGGGKK
jgi:hypothetical protein